MSAAISRIMSGRGAGSSTAKMNKLAFTGGNGEDSLFASPSIDSRLKEIKTDQDKVVLGVLASILTNASKEDIAELLSRTGCSTVDGSGDMGREEEEDTQSFETDEDEGEEEESAQSSTSSPTSPIITVETTTCASSLASPIIISVETTHATASVKRDSEHPSGDHKAILGVLSSIKATPRHADVVESALGFMKRLMQANKDENLMEHVVAAGGIALTISVMEKHPDKEGLQREGHALLNMLCKAVSQESNAAGIEAVLDVMKAHPDDVNLQTKCCHAVMESAENNEFASLIGNCGGIALIVSAMKTHPDAKKLLQSSLGALIRLTFSSEPNCQQLANVKGLEVVIELLKRHTMSVRMRHGITVLRNLTWNSMERMATIIEAGGHLEVVSYMRNHPDDAYIQENGCCTFANLADPNVDGFAAELDGADVISAAVVDAMSHHPQVIEVQRGGCEALRNLSLVGRSFHAEIVKAGGLEAIGAAIHLHSGDEDIVSRAKEAWNSVADAILQICVERQLATRGT